MNPKSAALCLGMFFFVANPFGSTKATAQIAAPEKSPSVLGKGLERFQIGKVLHRDDFETLERWVVQIEKNDRFPEPKVVAENGELNCRLPGRGCTIWFKEKLKNRLTITYDVVCPSFPNSDIKSTGLQPKDVNNFWLASDPADPAAGLFDSSRYDGGFNSYHKMNGYYASTGGGKNTTTRMRRYPREKDGLAVEHIALNSRDGKPEFMIVPDRLMQVQLVAFDDLIQYIVDGKLVYEIAYGDDVTTEKVLQRKKKVRSVGHYAPEAFPFYREGFFGFRMVGTHHIYSNFRVYELDELEPVQKQTRKTDAVAEPK